MCAGLHSSGMTGAFLKDCCSWLASCCERLCAATWKGAMSAGSGANCLRLSKTTAAAWRHLATWLGLGLELGLGFGLGFGFGFGFEFGLGLGFGFGLGLGLGFGFGFGLGLGLGC